VRKGACARANILASSHASMASAHGCVGRPSRCSSRVGGTLQA
jgi:hypothetical protein